MIKMRVVNDLIGPSLKIKKDNLSNLPKQAYDVFVKATPRKTGNARRQTKLDKSVIRADYDYAQPLDKGYSKQAPDGMTKPTEQFLRRQLDNIMKRK